MERRLFVITNNTHYVNLRKYLAAHDKGENLVLLVVNLFDGYPEFLRKIKQDKDLEILDEIFNPKKKRWPFHYWDIFNLMRKIRRIGNKSGNFDEVFFTNYNSWIQHYILKQFPQAKKIYISDGTAIFPIAENRKQNRSIPFSGNPFFIQKVLKLRPIDHLHFFAPVKLDLAPYDSLEVFSYDKGAGSEVDRNKIFFIGGPLVELGKLSLEVHLKYMENLERQFPMKSITYYAHRREKDDNLESYLTAGEVIRDELSFEERMASEKPLPGKVVSYVSSVLVNLAPVYPDVDFHYVEIEASDFPENNDFEMRYRKLVENFKKIEATNLTGLALTGKVDTQK